MPTVDENAQFASAYSQIMETLLALTPTVRGMVASGLQYNDAFCWHCGIDDPDCQCWNDE